MSGVYSTALKLLVCFCLLALSGVTLGQENGPDVVKVVVEEGRAVTLPCSLSTKQNIESKLFDWKKAQKELFMYDAGVHYNNGRPGQDEQFKGRVSHFQDELKHGNASIIITDTKVADSGDYTCAFPRLHPRQMFHIQLDVVAAAPKLYINRVNETKDWAQLQCEVHGSPLPEVEWQDSAGNKLPAEKPQVSERGGCSYNTLLTTVTKTGRYRCVATQREHSHPIHADTYVHFNGAASKPNVATLDETKDWSLLQCEVHGASPKPKVEWQDSAGKVLDAKEPQVSERGGSYDIILQTTVTKTDRYRCVATQEEINHRTEAETYVHINGFSIGWIFGAVFLTLIVVGVGLAVLVWKDCITLNCIKGSNTDQPPKGEEHPLNSPNPHNSSV